MNDEEYERTDAEEALKLAFSEEVTGALIDQKVSRAELARRCGKHTSFIAQVLRDDRNLTMETMSRMALALGCHVQVRLVPADKAIRYRPEEVEDGS